MNPMKECPCKKVKCERHGNCEECRNYHKDKKRPEYCMRKRKMKE